MMDDNIARIFSIASRLAWIFHYKDYQTEHGWHGLDGSSLIFSLSVCIRVIRKIRVQSQYYS